MLQTLNDRGGMQRSSPAPLLTNLRRSLDTGQGEKCPSVGRARAEVTCPPHLDGPRRSSPVHEIDGPNGGTPDAPWSEHERGSHE